jgi:hypothetical protein
MAMTADGPPVLLWEELKAHIHPAEVDNYARTIGLARISRNEDTFNELSILLRMQDSLNETLSSEIQKKNPPFLASAQRTTVINRAVKFLDSLRDQGHFIDPTDPNDSQILKYLKYTRSSRPSSSSGSASPRRRPPSSTRSVSDISESISDIQGLLDEEYARLQTDIGGLRCALFSTAEELDDVKSIEPPTTPSIEAFSKRLQTQEMVAKNMARTRGSSAVGMLRDSVRKNRLWE